MWALIASLYIGNVMLLILNLPLVKLWVQLLKIPKPQLYAGILIFATVGAYGMRQSAFDLVLLWAIGLVGVLMRRFDFPTAPVVVGMILGPLAEAQLRNAMSIGEGSRSRVPRAADVDHPDRGHRGGAGAAAPLQAHASTRGRGRDLAARRRGALSHRWHPASAWMPWMAQGGPGATIAA